jgi:hypothetical protein
MSISVLCTPMRVKGSVWIVSNIFPEWISALGCLFMWTLDGYSWQALVGSNQVFDIKITNIRFDSFWQLILNRLVPFRLHSFSAFFLCGIYAGLRNSCMVIHHVVSVSSLLQCAHNDFSSLSCLWAIRGIGVSYGRCLCDKSSWTYSHVMLWVHKNNFMGLCSLCGCSVKSYFFVAYVACSCTAKVHQGSFSCKQR